MNVIVRIDDVNFDSKVEIPDAKKASNCVIYLELRLRMVHFDGNSFVHKGKTYRTQPWPPGEWNVFRFRFKHICEHWWSHQFWLRSPTSFNEMNLPLGNPTHRPNFQCKLRIELLPKDTDRRHARITVIRLADDEDDLRSNSHLYDNRDIQVSYSDDHPHITAVHEVGHLLSLEHPGVRNRVPACLRDGNAEECYEPLGEAMGGGLGMIPDYANPWVQRLARHTHTKPADWTVFRHAIDPVSLSRERLMRDIVDGAQRRMRDRLIQSVEGL
ncbi:MAG TPA: hypothetical protein VH682_02000 [Gemmataceae bacterium]|jgi:hypothetical protein